MARTSRDLKPTGAAAEGPPTSLTLRLFDPSFTPLLRAGLGGLAATLRFIQSLPPARRPPGTWEVTPEAVTLTWGVAGGATPFFEALFRDAFQISAPHQMIYLPGAWGDVHNLPTLSALQDALRVTLLQHGKMAKKAGQPKVVQVELDRLIHTQVQPYLEYIQQLQAHDIAAQLNVPPHKARPLRLASWAQLGAVARHGAVPESEMEYSPSQAICACFALVGSVSLRVPQGGALVVPSPADLVRFAALRPRLTPSKVEDCVLAGVGDAALWVEVAARADTIEERAQGAVASVDAYLTRATAWASQQKSRVATVHLDAVSPESLGAYRELSASLPARLVTYEAKGKREAGSFVDPSVLRGFVCDNLALGRPWYTGFTQARDAKGERFLHTPWSSNNKGALRPEEAEGLRQMTQHLDPPEQVLIRAVHEALRRRLGAIASENQDNARARENRWERERERLRLAFAGAKTHEQVRFALADLFSRAGQVQALQDGWVSILPLLGAERWMDARDLSLIALASYRGRPRASTNDEPTDDALSNP